MHRKRSQVAVIDADGEVLANRNVPNGTETILGVIGGLPPGTPAVFEAAFGWGWLVELLEDYGFTPHLVHPLQCKAIASARCKNDKVDAAILARCCAPICCRRRGSPRRQCASCGRCCATGPSLLVRLRTLLRNRIHAVLADHGHDRFEGCWSGPGREWLASLQLPSVSRKVIEDDLALIGALQQPIDRLDWEVHQRARSYLRVKVLTQLPGAGPFTALVILAEVGDITRFGSARKLAAWAGLTTVRGSDRTVRHGHISKQGSVWARWSSVRGGADRQAAPGLRRQLPGHRPPPRQEDATTAIARKLLTRAYHALTQADITTPPAPAVPCAHLLEGRQAPGELAKPHEPARCAR